MKKEVVKKQNKETIEKMFENLADESCRHLTIWKLSQRARKQEEEEKGK